MGFEEPHLSANHVQDHGTVASPNVRIPAYTAHEDGVVLWHCPRRPAKAQDPECCMWVREKRVSHAFESVCVRTEKENGDDAILVLLVHNAQFPPVTRGIIQRASVRKRK